MPPVSDAPDSDEVVVVESSPAYENVPAPPSPARFEDDVSMEMQQDELAGTDAGRDMRGPTEPMSNPESAALEDADLAALHGEQEDSFTKSVKITEPSLDSRGTTQTNIDDPTRPPQAATALVAPQRV